MKSKSRIGIGDKVEFVSGNYKGLTGEVVSTDWNAKGTTYGVRHKVKLSNWAICYIEKAEHFKFIE